MLFLIQKKTSQTTFNLFSVYTIFFMGKKLHKKNCRILWLWYDFSEFWSDICNNDDDYYDKISV